MYDMQLFDPFTGKPVNKPSDLLPTANGCMCSDCGAALIDRCPACGAPQCCPRCCYESSHVSEKP